MDQKEQQMEEKLGDCYRNLKCNSKNNGDVWRVFNRQMK
jgi:hypothetical protein